MMRTLLVCREGAPLFTELTSKPIREYLVGCDGIDDPLLYQIWDVSSLDRATKAEDITKRFAYSWSREIAFGEGIVPEDYLTPFPAFCRAHTQPELMERFAKEMADRIKAAAEPDYLPPVRRRA